MLSKVAFKGCRIVTVFGANRLQWVENDRPAHSRTRSAAAGSLQGSCWVWSAVGPLQADAASHRELPLWPRGFQPLHKGRRAERGRVKAQLRTTAFWIFHVAGGAGTSQSDTTKSKKFTCNFRFYLIYLQQVPAHRQNWTKEKKKENTNTFEKKVKKHTDFI